MDIKRKKQLLEEYRNRHPEKGIVSYRCKATGENFLGIAEDAKAVLNSNNFKLSMNGHPNKRLQELWNKYGEENFECSVIKTLKYENPTDDHTEELEKLREQCLEDDMKARKIWK